MGVSGPENFQDDRAFNYLILLMKKLEKDVEDSFLAYEKGELDLDQGNRVLMPSMDILITLSEHYGLPINLNKEQVRTWKATYLQLYDDTIDEYIARPSYKENRRKVIERTFTELERLCLPDTEV